MGRHVAMPPTPNSSARCRNLHCVFHVIVKLSGCQGLTLPSKVTGMDAKDLCCPTTSTSSYGSENHTALELIVGIASHATPSCCALHQSTSRPAWLATTNQPPRWNATRCLGADSHISNESARSWWLRSERPTSR